MLAGVTVQRRRLLAGLTVAVATPFPSFAGALGLQVWVHESRPEQAGSLVLGALFVREPAALAAALTAARRRTKFYRPLRYADTNRFKRDYAHAALDAVLADTSSHYAALVAPWPSDPQRRRAIYYDAYVSLLRGEAGAGLALNKRPNRTVGPEAALDRYLTQHLPTVRPAPRRSDDIAELTGFITGNVAASARRPDSPVKSELLGHVMARLAANARFSVRAI